MSNVGNIEVQTVTKFQNGLARVITTVKGRRPILSSWLVTEVDDVHSGELCYLNYQPIELGQVGMVVEEPDVVFLNSNGDLVIGSGTAENYSINENGEPVYQE